MSNFPRPIRWLFAAPAGPVTALRVIGWWELRRIPFNLVIGIFGLFSLGIFSACIQGANVLHPDDDAFEPIGLILGLMAANLCYTAGWLLDAPLRVLLPKLRPHFTPCLFRVGLGFSLFFISLPAVYWSCYRLLQLLEVIQ